MIAELLLAAQLAGPEMVLVRTGARADTVPLVRTAAGPALRADLLAAPLGATLARRPDGHFDFVLDDVRFDLADHVPFVRVGTEVLPLVAAPWVFDGTLYVPLQLVAEVLPRPATRRSRAAHRRGARRPASDASAWSWWMPGTAGPTRACPARSEPGAGSARRTSRSPWPRAWPRRSGRAASTS